MKTTLTLILCTILLVTLAACANTNGEQPSVSQSNTVKPQESNAPTPTPESGNAAAKNHIRFDLTPESLNAGEMIVTADYSKDDIISQSFMLNRDFEVMKILCDNQAVDLEQAKERVVLGDDYEINLYHLPPFERDIHIEYRGILNGTTGAIPRPQNGEEALNDMDTISSEFTLLRYKTVFHPLFADPESYVDAMNTPFLLRVTVNVPEGYMAAFAYAACEETNTPAGKSFTTIFDVPYTDVGASVAMCQKVETHFGDIYLLENSTMDISWINAPLSEDFFKDSWFGDIYCDYEPINIVEIPESCYRQYYAGKFLSFINSRCFNFYFGLLPLLEAEPESISFPKFEGDTCSMLFVGDSYINPIAEQLQPIAAQYGIDIQFDEVCKGGSMLSDLIGDALKAIENNQYDFVVVQDMHWFNLEGEIIGIDEIETLFNAARERGSTPVLYNAADGQAYVDTDGQIMPDPYWRRINTTLDEIFAKRLGAVLVNASQARVYAYEKIPDISLFKDDGPRHSTVAGVYHNACVMAATLFDIQVKEPVINVLYQEDDAIKLAQSAWEYVTWYKEHQTYPE